MKILAKCFKISPFSANLSIHLSNYLATYHLMNPNNKPALIPDQLTETKPDSFIAVPRDADTAVVYWNVANANLPFDGGGRLCLQINGQTSDVNETIILHREAGHFIVPLLADERKYQLELGWSDMNGFSRIFVETIELPALDSDAPGAHSSAVDYRGTVFWTGSAN